jgi:hypothetical protein
MSKEAARIVKQITQNDLPNIVTKVEVNNEKEFTSCVEKVASTCPKTVIMLLAAPANMPKMMYVGVSIPEHAEQLSDWLSNSIANASIGGTITNMVNKTGMEIISITYPENSECFPFKYVDEVNGVAFSILKKLGMQKEESDEEEYGVDL